MSLDIDVIDPSMAPASASASPSSTLSLFSLPSSLARSSPPFSSTELTSDSPAAGTPESGGWTTRELKAILRGLSSLHLVGLDLVEVSPAYDTNAELTGMAAADLVQEFLGMLTRGKGERGRSEWEPAVSGGVLHDEREQVGEAAGAKSGHDEL